MTNPKQALCWNPEWRYVRSESTNIRARFDAIRAAQQANQPKQPQATVTPIKRAKP